MGPALIRSMRLSRQELGAAGECSGIRRAGSCCGASYSLWPSGYAGLPRMGSQRQWRKPGVPVFPVFFNTIEKVTNDNSYVTIDCVWLITVMSRGTRTD